MMSDPRVALITGSSSGIGAAAAKLFAKKGFKVAVTGSNREKVNSVVKDCNALSPHNYQALALVADLFEGDNCVAIVQKTVAHFGKLDVLVNNAGIFRKTHSADKSSFDDYKAIMDINCDSVIKTSMEAVPHLKKSNGNIVFVSSVASIKPGPNNYAYRMSKAAISSYAKCLAIDVAPEIRVNIVSPGPTHTPMLGGAGLSEEKIKQKSEAILLKRLGAGDEIAATIYYLASEDASFVNGAEFFVDGGYLLQSI